MVEVVWPLSVPACHNIGGNNVSGGVLPLRTFIQETLRRSRSSFSTLQVALYYLILIKAHVPKFDFTMEQPEDMPSCRALQCGRRMFLAALILASKYLQDHNYSARAWSKISGLKVCEINTNEMAFLQAVNWKLHVPEQTFERWSDVIIKFTSSSHNPPPSPNAWKAVIPMLTPELDTVEVTPRTPDSAAPKASARAVGPWDSQVPALSPVRSLSGHAPLPLNANTSFKVARYLEPKIETLPPTPSLARMGPLPTPQLTPQSTVSYTPAASLAACGSRRPSICGAMAQVQMAAQSRMTMDMWTPKSRGLEAYRMSSRRSSVTQSSASSSSSPESMVSDNSSRFSRSSSISSASSAVPANWMATQTPVKLCRLATLNNAQGLPFSKNIEMREPTIVEPISSPDFEGFSITDACPTTPLHRVQSHPVTSSQSSAASKGRKRGRSSINQADIALQANVRSLLQAAPRAVRSDRNLAKSFLFDAQENAQLSPSVTPTPGPKCLQRLESRTVLPVQKVDGRKRACCATEAKAVVGRFRFEGGPGMWEGVL
ncbi:hypothetical protein K402DRAFT_129231 [Aulographum hederae CBS 113979]|uniref:Cyclin N-terminal domain-containing protein n=1 Tax=Aulographum hederae CBS 113979 TaxID=1176131 RepID=A0A6G1HEK4_9PEZI|nr:hypothetical protein K402DRAFT_129231 [Aulographum hederae CBS 113979]